MFTNLAIERGPHIVECISSFFFGMFVFWRMMIFDKKTQVHDLGGDLSESYISEDIVKENTHDIFPYIINGVNSVNPTVNPPRN